MVRVTDHLLTCCLQGHTNWTTALAVSPGMDIQALQIYQMVPSPVCANTTSNHYACTISHLLLLLQAFRQGEVWALPSFPSSLSLSLFRSFWAPNSTHSSYTSPWLLL